MAPDTPPSHQDTRKQAERRLDPDGDSGSLFLFSTKVKKERLSPRPPRSRAEPVGAAAGPL